MRNLARVALLLCLATAGSIALAQDEAAIIRSDFPGGNILVTKNSAATIELEPDLRGDRPWFYWYFEAEAVRPGPVRFVFPEKVIGFKNGAIGFQGPAFSADRGLNWNWMGTQTVDGNAFTYDFAKAGDQVQFAVTIPYTHRNLNAFLLRNVNNAHLGKFVLTKSRKGRKVTALQIGEPATEREPVLVTGRHHATETMASFLLEGFLQEAMSDSAAGKAFREKHVLFAVPIVDTDGVEEGDQGKNRKPHDHNRDYGEKSIYPEIQAIRKLDEKHDFRFALDFHCPTLVMKDHQVMYFVGAKEHPPWNFDNVSQFANQIKQRLPKSAPYGPLVWLKKESKPAPMNSRYFGFKKNAIMAATLEFPFAPPGKATDPKSCREYGKAVLQAWVATRFISSEGRD